MSRPPPTTTLFPYTTLFRSLGTIVLRHEAGERRRVERAAADEDRPRGRRTRPVTDHQQPHRVSQLRMTLTELRDAVRLLMIGEDRKSTRLNSSHLGISYAVF